MYNYYSSGDPVFMEDDTIPSVLTGVFHWPTLHWTWPFIDLNITAEAYSWQKQETHKGVEPVAGTLKGGWGFYCWVEVLLGQPCFFKYSASEASVMVADGTITNNPVFHCAGTQMDNPDATINDIYMALAKYVPAVSSPIGKSRALKNDIRNYNLNSADYKNGWGRNHNVYFQSWMHSDMKDMAYFYVCPLYLELISKGGME